MMVEREKALADIEKSMVELAKLRVLKAKVAKALKLGMWGPRIPMTSLLHLWV